MRHHKIQKSKRHKKLKSIESPKEFNFIKDQLIEQIKDQPVPRKLTDLMKTKNQNPKKNTKEINKNKKEKIFKQKYNILTVKTSKLTAIEKGMTRVPKPLPEKVEKGLMESDSHFMSRLNRMVSKAMAEANLEDHFDVDLGKKVKDSTENNTDTDHTQNAKVKDTEKKKDKRKLKDFKRKAKKMKKQHRLIKQLEKSDDFSFKKDTIQFGELVHQPPNFVYKNSKKCKK